MLKPVGTIGLSLPNLERVSDSHGEGDYPSHHLARWSKKALSIFLEKNGLEVHIMMVKEVTVDDVSLVFTHKLAGKVNSRLTKGVATAAPENISPTFILHNYQEIKKLMGYVMRGALLPLIPALKVLKANGQTIFCTA